MSRKNAGFASSAGSPLGGPGGDVRDERLAQVTAALREVEERLSLAASAARFGLYDANLVTGVTYWSPELRALLGIPLDAPSVAAGTVPEFIHPEDRERFSAKITASLDPRSSAVFEDEHRIVRSDGSVRWVLLKGSATFTGEGEERRPVRLTGLVMDITERRERSEQTQLLLAEVSHRSKNLLALVQAIARQTFKTGREDFIDRFEERLFALAASHDLLIRGELKGIDLAELVRSQLAHFAELIGTRISLHGPHVTLAASAGQTLGMAVHELATNAGKYGALSNDVGSVAISWAILPDETTGARFAMSWIECDGPPVQFTTRRGFGSLVIDRMARNALDAAVALRFAPEGITWRLECAAARVLDDRRELRGPMETDPAPAATAAPCVLVAEDDGLVALELAAAIEEAGYRVVGPASSVVRALALLDRTACNCAVLDVALGSESAEPIARRLRRDGVPFITVSGYGPEQRPPVFDDAPFLSKPLRPADLIATIERCRAAHPHIADAAS